MTYYVARNDTVKLGNQAIPKLLILFLGCFLMAGARCVPQSPNKEKQTFPNAAIPSELGCTEISETIPVGMEHSTDSTSRRITVKHLDLNPDTSVEITESQLPIGHDDFATQLEIRQSLRKVHIPVRQYIKYGDSLYLRGVRLACANPRDGLLALAFEAGSTGFLQGFLFVKFSRDHVTVSAVPIVQQGMIEIKRENPYRFDLWGADRNFQGVCDACTKRYWVKSCRVTAGGATCERLKQPLVAREPNEVTADLIRVH